VRFLSEEVISQIQALAEHEEASWWALADLVLVLIEEFAHVPGAAAMVRREVAYAARLSPETVRDMVWMARRIPEKVRGEYPMLSRHQWKAVLAAGKQWEEAAAWAADNMASVREIRQYARALRAGEDAPDEAAQRFDWEARAAKAAELLVPLLDDENAPREVALLVERLLEALRRWQMEKDALRNA